MQNLNEPTREKIARECESVFLQIAHLTDHGPQAKISDFFTENAEMDRDGTLVSGRSALNDLYAKRPPNLMTRHLVSNLLVTPISDREAHCQAIATVYRYRGADSTQAPLPPVTTSGPESIVEYLDHLILSEEGWKISKRMMKTVIHVK